MKNGKKKILCSIIGTIMMILAAMADLNNVISNFSLIKFFWFNILLYKIIFFFSLPFFIILVIVGGISFIIYKLFKFYNKSKIIEIKKLKFFK
jgi:hypothetical protein